MTASTSGGGDGSGEVRPHPILDGVIDLVAGTMGGVANVYTGQPLDTVKVKMQTFPHLYKSWPSCVRDTYRLDGIRGLYAGTLPALVANVAENAVLFTAYGYCQKAVSLLMGRSPDSGRTDATPAENALAGSFAAVFAATVLCPTELVKCRLQAARETNPGQHFTSASICRTMWRERGLRAFYVGMTPTLAREVPGYACFFGAYEAARYAMTPPGKTKDEIGVFRTAVAGGLGGMALWTAIFPADVIKSRMQVSGGGRFGEMLLKITREEGIGALYKGLAPTLLRTCIASGCLFVAYENSRRLMLSFFV